LTSQEIEALIVTLVFMGVFLFGKRLLLPKWAHRRQIVSLFGGMTIAYIFLHLLPALSEGAVLLSDTSANGWPPPAEVRVFGLAMVGFIAFWGLEHMVWRHARRGDYSKARGPLMLYFGGLAAYTWLITYLLVDPIEEGHSLLWLYAVAMVAHFLALSYSLQRDFGSYYDSVGAKLLAGAALLGWIVGLLVQLPLDAVVLLAGLVAGGVIMNSILMELPREKEGRFIPFLGGALGYGVVLLFL
jgi:hypothetical protein